MWHFRWNWGGKCNYHLCLTIAFQQWNQLDCCKYGALVRPIPHCSDEVGYNYSHSPRHSCVRELDISLSHICRLRGQIKDTIQPEPISESQKWNEYVVDKLVKKFARKRASTLPQSSRGDYGFPAGDRVVPTLQSDLAKLADSYRHVDSAAITPGMEEWRGSSSDLHSNSGSEGGALKQDEHGTSV